MSKEIKTQTVEIGRIVSTHWSTSVKVKKQFWDALDYREKRGILHQIDEVQGEIDAAMELGFGRVVSDIVVDEYELSETQEGAVAPKKGAPRGKKVDKEDEKV